MKNKIFKVLLLVMFLMATDLQAQNNVGIGTTTPDASAILELQSTTQGVLIPRMTIVQRGNISSPATGLLVYQTDGIFGFYYYTGTAWTNLNEISEIVDADGNTKIQVEKTANDDIIRFDLGGTEYWKMVDTRLEPVNTGRSLFIGFNAGKNDNLSNNDNVFIGYDAGHDNTTGIRNSAVGNACLYFNTGNYNVAMGNGALYNNTGGSTNSAFGTRGLYSNTTGLRNTSVGYKALYANTTSNDNTAIGVYSMNNNTTGASNTALGLQSLYTNSTGVANVAIGINALYSNVSGVENSAVGNGCLYFNTGNYNVAMGSEALWKNTSGRTNSAFGTRGLSLNTTGSGNTSVGFEALIANTTSNDNTAIGVYSMNNNTTGASNTALGLQSLYTNTTGVANVAVGIDALYGNTDGNSNSAVGHLALQNNTTGDFNSAIGKEALLTNTTGSNNAALGYKADVTSGGLSNATAIGYNAKATASNTMVLGGTGVDAVKVGVGTNSPGAVVHVYKDADMPNITDSHLLLEGGNTNDAWLRWKTSGTNVFSTGIDGGTAVLSTWGYNGNFYLGFAQTVDGKVGIGTTSPDEELHVAGDMRLNGAFEDKDGEAGFSGQILASTGSGTDWVHNGQRTVTIKPTGNATVVMGEASNFIIVQSTAAAQTVSLPTTITSADIGKGFEIYNKGATESLSLSASGITLTGYGDAIGPESGVSIVIISVTEYIVIGAIIN